MRVLYANPERHDYLHAGLLEGLLGHEGVETWSLEAGNHGEGAARCLHGDAAEAVDALPSFDAVVIGTSGKHSILTPAVRAVLGAERPAGQRWVLVDSGDLGSLPRRLPWARFDSVVKRELFLPGDGASAFLAALAARKVRHPLEYQFRRHRWLAFPNVQANALARPAAVSFHRRRQWRLPRGTRLRCEPIGLERRLAQVPNPSPVRAVTCTLTPNTPARRQLLAHLRQRARGDVLVRTVGPDDYLGWLRGHRASISFPGGGFDTARFWEILGSGSLLLSKRVALDLPVPLVDGVHYVGFDTLAELDEAIDFALGDSDEVDAVRRRGHELATTRYSSRAMADRLVELDLSPGPGRG